MFAMDNDCGRRNGLKYKLFKVHETNGKMIPVGKTVAYINECAEDAINTIDKIMTNGQGWKLEPMIYVMPNSFKDYSKCNYEMGDSFDGEFGRNLAKSRVLEKYHRSYNKQLKSFLFNIRNLAAYCEHYLDKHRIDYSDVISVQDLKAKTFKGKN